MNPRVTALSALAVALLATPFSLSAQSSGDTSPAAAPPRAAEEEPLAEVVVTAQLRPESLQRVPFSVTVASAADLQARNLTDPAELPLLVPSLQLTSFLGAPGATNFSVRGIGTASFSHLLEPSVATVIDGIVMTRPEMGVANFNDLARVEVLNGPQGMLFGKNASAGLVNIVTNRPELGVFQSNSDLSYENVDAAHHASVYNLSSTLNLPLSSLAAVRVSGFYNHEGSLIGNTEPTGYDDFARDERGMRVKLLVEPLEGLSVYVSADYTQSDGLGTGYLTPRSEGPALAALEAAAGVTPSPNNFYQSSNAPSDLHYTIFGTQSEVSYAFSNGLTLTNIAGYRSYVSDHTLDLDLLQINLLDTTAARFRFEQLTEELRLTSPQSGPFEYQAGLFFYTGFDRRIDHIRGQLGMSVPPPDGSATWLGLNAQDDLHPRSYAAYAQGTYHITDRFSLTAGGRETHDVLHFDGGYNQDDIFITIAGGPGAKSYLESQSKSNFSWRTSAQYDLASNTNAYLTVAHGYKGPGYNLSWAGTPGAQPVGPETSFDYEAGVKTTLFNKLILNVGAYWETFSDFQVQSFQASGVPGVGSFIVQNAGKLRARGLESNFSYRLTPTVTLSGGGAFNDAVYLRFQGAPCYVGQTVAEGCVDGTVDASGNRLANAPRWTGMLAADYRQPLDSGRSVIAHTDLSSRSAINFSSTDNPYTAQSGYSLFNASLGLAGVDDLWTLRAYCRNCFDRHFVTSIAATVVGGPGDYGQSFALDSFRSIGLSLNLRFKGH